MANRGGRWRAAVRFASVTAAGFGALASPTGASASNGVFLNGVGPVNASLGGAGTAAFLDPISALAWNPAGTQQFNGRTVQFSLDWVNFDSSVGSMASASAFAPGLPPFDLAGSTDSLEDNAFLPTFAFVRKLDDRDLAFHVGMMGLAGIATHYPADTNLSPGANIVVTPQPPFGFGFGEIRSEFGLVRLPVGISAMVTPRLAVGASVIPAYQSLRLSPGIIAAPDDANGDFIPSYPAVDDTASEVGVGFQFGLTFAASRNVTLGFSLATPTSFGSMKWDAVDEVGAPRQLSFDLDLPAFFSAGISYQVSDSLLLAFDLRRIEYADTNGYKGGGFKPDASLNGLGWDDTWTVGIGAQKTLRDGLRIRFGYNYGENPVSESLNTLSIPAPSVAEHHLTLGLSVRVGEAMDLHLGYYHTFENSVDGPLLTPAGPADGTLVTNTFSQNALSVGFTLRN